VDNSKVCLHCKAPRLRVRELQSSLAVDNKSGTDFEIQNPQCLVPLLLEPTLRDARATSISQAPNE